MPRFFFFIRTSKINLNTVCWMGNFVQGNVLDGEMAEEGMTRYRIIDYFLLIHYY